jgi:hypothetical protein
MKTTTWVLLPLLALLFVECGSRTGKFETDEASENSTLIPSQSLEEKASSPFLDDCDRFIPNDLIAQLTHTQPMVSLPEHWTKESSFECGRVYRLIENSKSYFSVVYYEHVQEQDAVVRMNGIRGQSTFKNEVDNLGDEAIFNERTGPVESATYSFRRGKIVYFVTNHYRADIPSEQNALSKDALIQLAKGIDVYYAGL